MTLQDQIEFHAARAAAERSLAERAASLHAARAHLGLSVLHLDRLNALASSQPPAIQPIGH